jgi:hypothetical protein
MHSLSIFHTSSKRKIYLLCISTGIVVYCFILRPWHRNWGSTTKEASNRLPGDELLPSAPWNTTHAITIHAPANKVWPWGVQIGQGRGGFYSYDWLENLFGLDIHNANTILTEHQLLKPGDFISFWRGVGLTVREVEPPNLLVLAGALGGKEDTIGGSWAFYLTEQEPGFTRLIIRTRSVFGPFWVAPLVCLIGEPAAFIMERRMMLGIKKRAETRMEFSKNPIHARYP